MSNHIQHSWQLLKKICALVRYDLFHHIHSWLYIIGVQVVVHMILSAANYLPGDFLISMPEILFGLKTFNFVIGQDYTLLGFDLQSLLMIIKIASALLYNLCLCILFPLVIIQNALDLAFDSSMRLYSFKGNIVSYLMVVYSFFIVRHALLNFYHNVIEYIWYQSAHIMSVHIGLAFFSCLIFILYSYFFQRLRFVSMHILEYQQGLKDSIKASLRITQDKFLLLSYISILQMVMILCFLVSGVGIFIFMDNVINIIFSSILNRMIVPLSIIIMIKSYVVSLLKFLFWSQIVIGYVLIEAHVYRMLVSPEDRINCSCECEA